MKGISLMAMIAILPVIVSCGKNPLEAFGAPKSKSHLGVIASCTTVAQAQNLTRQFGGQYRLINEKKKIVEFYGIDKSDIKDSLPKAKLLENKIYENLVESTSKIQNVSSSNIEFFGPHSPEYRSNSSSSYFPHLEQISGSQIYNNIQGQGVTIAIIDTGVYYNHPHLSPNIKLNNSDSHGQNSNGLDDDGNGFADDYVGWDFYNHDAYPIDDHGHGTHVAGLAAGTFNGVAPKAKIMPIKVLSDSGSGDLGTIAAGILYAIENGAKVINLSLGGPSSGEMTQELTNLINIVKLAKDNNVMIVAAAGNGGSDGVGDCNDEKPIYPANIDSSNVISVASVNAYNELTEYSNFGGNTVHVAAPGGDRYTGGLVSTGISNCFGPCNTDDAYYYSSMGTSMAAPVVAGLVALIKSATNKSLIDIKNIIMQSGVKVSELNGKVKSAKVIHVRNALITALNQ